jgi:hypothetical protein
VPADIVPALNVVYFPQIGELFCFVTLSFIADASTGFLISVALPPDWTPDMPLFTEVSDWKYQFNTECVF